MTTESNLKKYEISVIFMCYFALQKQAAFSKYDIAIQEMQHDEKIAAKKSDEAARLKDEQQLNRVMI